MQRAHLTYLVAMLLMAVPLGAQAQLYLEKERLFYGGLVAGANFTQVDGDQYAGYHKKGLNVGGIVYITLDEHVAASMEILYSQKGSKSKGGYEIRPGEFITSYGVKLNYAEVPVMINYFDKRKSHFGGGLSYSRLASVQEYLTTQPATNIDLNKYPFKKGDLNIVLGGNLHMWKGLFLNVRFQYSLLSIRDKVPNDYAKSSQTNNMWVIRLMYLLFM